MTRTLLDSFWRAAAYCLHPKVIALSLAPLAVVGGGIALLGYFFWETAVDAVRGSLEQWSLLASFFAWLASVGAGNFQSVFAPLVIVALAIPLCVVASLVVVAWLMTPAMVRLVELRRFPALQRRQGAGFLAEPRPGRSAAPLVALLALAASLPLWFIPPLVLVLPPLIWGWLTYRVLLVRRARRCTPAATSADALMRGAPLAAARHGRAHRLSRRRARRCSGRWAR